jgi:hypothetical protein
MMRFACLNRFGGASWVRWYASFDLGLVKKLREETKAGVMACRDALEAANGDFAAARETVLRQQKNRAGKPMAEGLVAVAALPHTIACVEVACETDFVARGSSLARLAAAAASAAASAPSHLDEARSVLGCVGCVVLFGFVWLVCLVLFGLVLFRCLVFCFVTGLGLQFAGAGAGERCGGAERGGARHGRAARRAPRLAR